MDSNGQKIVLGSRVSVNEGWRKFEGTVGRVISEDGALGGIFEIKADGFRLKRSMSWFPGRDLTIIK